MSSEIELGEIVIYQLSDGQGGFTERAAIVIKVTNSKLGIVNLKIFAEEAYLNDMTYQGIAPGSKPWIVMEKHAQIAKSKFKISRI